MIKAESSDHSSSQKDLEARSATSGESSPEETHNTLSHSQPATTGSPDRRNWSPDTKNAIDEFYKLPPKERRRLKRLVHPSKRKRIAVACDSCKRRKQKCDGNNPCSLCKERNFDCVFSKPLPDQRIQALIPLVKGKIRKNSKSFSKDKNDVELDQDSVPDQRRLSSSQPDLSPPNHTSSESPASGSSPYSTSLGKEPGTSAASGVNASSPPFATAEDKTRSPNEKRQSISLKAPSIWGSDPATSPGSTSASTHTTLPSMVQLIGKVGSSPSAPASGPPNPYPSQQYPIKSPNSSAQQQHYHQDSQQQFPRPILPFPQLSQKKHYSNSSSSYQRPAATLASANRTVTSEDYQVKSVDEGKDARLLYDGPSSHLRYLGESCTMSVVEQTRRLFRQRIGPTAFTEDPRRHKLVAGPTFHTSYAPMQLPSKRLTILLTKSFEKYVQPTGYVLSFPQFYKEIDLVYDSPVSASTSQLCLLYLDIALGSLFFLTPPVEHAAPELRKELESINTTRYFESALGLLRDSFDDGDIWVVQAYLLVAIYFEAVCKRDACWIHLGIAIRFAQGLGMGRKWIDRSFSPDLQQHRKRLFRTLYWHDRHKSLQLGRPPVFGSDDVEDYILENPKNREDEAQIQMVKLCKILGDIWKDVYKSKTISNSTSCSLTNRLKDWSSSFQKFARETAVQSEQQQQQQNYLRKNNDPASDDVGETDVPKDPKKGSSGGLIDVSHKIPWDQHQLLNLNLTYLHGIILLTRPFHFYMTARKRETTGNASVDADITRTFENLSSKCVQSALTSIKLMENTLSHGRHPKRSILISYYMLTCGFILLLRGYRNIPAEQPSLSLGVSGVLKILSYYSNVDPSAERFYCMIRDMNGAVAQKQKLDQAPAGTDRNYSSSFSSNYMMNEGRRVRSSSTSLPAPSFSPINSTDPNINRLNPSVLSRMVPNISGNPGAESPIPGYPYRVDDSRSPDASDGDAKQNTNGTGSFSKMHESSYQSHPSNSSATATRAASSLMSLSSLASPTPSSLESRSSKNGNSPNFSLNMLPNFLPNFLLGQGNTNGSLSGTDQSNTWSGNSTLDNTPASRPSTDMNKDLNGPQSSPTSVFSDKNNRSNSSSNFFLNLDEFDFMNGDPEKWLFTSAGPVVDSILEESGDDETPGNTNNLAFDGQVDGTLNRKRKGEDGELPFANSSKKHKDDAGFGSSDPGFSGTTRSETNNGGNQDTEESTGQMNINGAIGTGSNTHPVNYDPSVINLDYLSPDFDFMGGFLLHN